MVESFIPGTHGPSRLGALGLGNRDWRHRAGGGVRPLVRSTGWRHLRSGSGTPRRRARHLQHRNLHDGAALCRQRRLDARHTESPRIRSIDAARRRRRRRRRRDLERRRFRIRAQCPWRLCRPQQLSLGHRRDAHHPRRGGVASGRRGACRHRLGCRACLRGQNAGQKGRKGHRSQ